MLGKREENGVSTQNVLSITPNAHITPKHVKKGHLVKSCHFTPLMTYEQPIVKDVKLYIIMLELIISYTLLTK